MQKLKMCLYRLQRWLQGSVSMYHVSEAREEGSLDRLRE